MEHLRVTEMDPDALLNQWRNDRPEHRTDQDLLSEYGWVVACCGLTPHVMMKLWDRLSEAFRGWDPAAVAANPVHVRTAALEVMKNPRKWNVIIDLADSLAREPGQMKRLAALPAKEAVAWFGSLPYVGENNRYHLARNLGWDVPVRNGPVPRLAAYLLTTSEELCQRIANETGERIRTVDLVLWNWGYQVGDAAVKEMASLFRLL